jgi:hypothetical protein
MHPLYTGWITYHFILSHLGIYWYVWTVTPLRQSLTSSASARIQAFRLAVTQPAAVDGRRGSNVHEVISWLWQFGRCKSRLGGLTVEQTETRKDAVTVVNARNKHAAETRRSRTTPPAGFKVKGGMSEYVLGDPKTSQDISGCTAIYLVYTEYTNGLQTVFFNFDCRRRWNMHGICMHAS